MSMNWLGTVTEEGLGLLSDYMAGSNTLYITKVEGGTETFNDLSAMRAATALNAYADTGRIAEIKPFREATVEDGDALKGEGTQFFVEFGPKEGDAGYDLKEVGLFAKLGENGTEKLLAVAQTDGNGISVPARTQIPDFVFRLSMPIAMGYSEKSIKIVIDPAASVSYSTFESKMDVVDVGFYVDDEGFLCQRIYGEPVYIKTIIDTGNISNGSGTDSGSSSDAGSSSDSGSDSGSDAGSGSGT